MCSDLPLRLGEFVPAAPRAGMRLRLPDVPQLVIGTDAEDFESAVGVEGGGDLLDPAAEAIQPLQGPAWGTVCQTL